MSDKPHIQTPVEMLAHYLYEQHFETCDHYCGFNYESAMERAQNYLDVAAGNVVADA